MTQPYEPEFVQCYKCKCRVKNKKGVPVCDKCWNDNMQIAAAGWKDADKLTVQEVKP